MEAVTFHFPTWIRFGRGVRHEVPGFLQSRALKRPLVVTDRGIRDLPLLHEFLSVLRESRLEPEVYSEVHGNPGESQVSQGVRAFGAHGADSIIGFGGGAALDVAKAIALMIHHPGELFEYEDGIEGARPIALEIPPWVALPTTAGTGSEVGRSSVISDEKTHLKKIIFSPKLLPSAVFADPELTFELRPPITAATGMDALTHCLEAYLAKAYHPICDGIALEGIRLIADSLPAAVLRPRTPEGKEARAQMLMASMMGAIAFQKGLGITHSCAHALSAVKDVHHGLANGILVDHALRCNAEAAAEKFRRIAQVLELHHRPSVGRAEDAAEAVLQWLEALKARIGIPARLRQIGVGPENLEQLAKLALEDGCHAQNPRPCGFADFRQVFEDAI